MRRMTHRAGRRRQRGRGIMDFLGRAKDFLQKSNLVSTVGNALSSAGVPYAGAISNVASRFGYGRKRLRKGRGLKLAGSGIGIAGGRMRRR